MFNPINLKTALRKEEQHLRLGQSEVVDQVYEMLNAAAQEDQACVLLLKGTKEKCAIDLPASDFTEDDKFSIQSIQKVCIKYRLRFLDAKLFKGEIPYRALLKIKQLQRTYPNIPLHFKIVAPAKRFLLKDSEADPLLFVKLSDHCYLLLHQWGKEIRWYKKMLYYPLRHPLAMLITIAIFSTIVALGLPNSAITDAETSHLSRIYRVALFVWTFFASCAFTFYFGFVLRKNFSSFEWKSRFFN